METAAFEKAVAGKHRVNEEFNLPLQISSTVVLKCMNKLTMGGFMTSP